MKKEIKSKISGFTLIELMLTLAIAAILITLAIPNFRDTMQNNRAYTQSNSLLTALNITRSEATKKRMDVFICSSTVATTCTTEANCCNGGADWSTGWVVVDDNDNIIQRWESLDGEPTLAGPDHSDGDNKMFYAATGRSSMAPTFNCIYDRCTGNNNYSVVVSASGRPSVSKAACP